MMRLLASCLRSRRAAAGAEFGLIVPVLFLLLFGIIDVGRFMWQLNMAEKATQVGVRMAVVTTPVSPGLVAHNFATVTLPTGSTIPETALGAMTCTSTSCTCTGTCPVTDLSVNSAAFNAILARMQGMYGAVQAQNVQIIYRGSGFGIAGTNTPGGASAMEISPLVTVRLTGITFSPLITLALANFSMPSATTTMTAEDSFGAVSN